MKDEVLQEVWKVKDDLAGRHNYDVRRLAEALKAKEGTSGHIIFDLHAREQERRTSGGTGTLRARAP